MNDNQVWGEIFMFEDDIDNIREKVILYDPDGDQLKGKVIRNGEEYDAYIECVETAPKRIGYKTSGDDSGIIKIGEWEDDIQ